MERTPLKRLIGSAIPGAWGEDAVGDDTDVVCIRVADFIRDTFNATASKAPTRRQLDVATERKLALAQGDILLERSGDTGYPARYVGEPGAVFSNFLLRLRAKPEVDARYLWYVLQWAYLSGIVTACTNRTTMSNLDIDAYMAQRMPLWPLATQCAIANYLDRETARIDVLVAAKRRMVELLEDRFVRFVQSLVDPSAPLAQGRLIPLKHMAKIERGVFSHRPRNDPAFYDGPHPFIQTGDVARARKYVESWTQTLNDRGLAVSRKFPVGTLTMVIAANIGDVGITTFEACFPDSVVGIEANVSILDSNYLYFGLLSAKKRLVEMAPVTTQANLNVERIGSLDLRCPSLEDQRTIANRLDAELQRVDWVAGRERKSIDVLQERRQALITAAVTGQFDVPKAA